MVEAHLSRLIIRSLPIAFPYIALFLQNVKLVGEKYLAVNVEGSEG